MHRWGEHTERNPLVLIHGSAAHARWWDHLAPAFAAGRLVLAPELSGHGDSDRRSEYSIEAWAAEIRDVLAALAPGRRVVLVGHSLGGLVGLHATVTWPELFSGLVLVDSAARPSDPLNEQRRARRAARSPARMRSLSDATRRFKLHPPAVRPKPGLLAYLARTSVRAADDGWTWAFDWKIFGRPPFGLDRIRSTAVPVLLIRGEHGLIDPAAADRLLCALGCADNSVVTIQDAGHHVMVDQPERLYDEISSALRRWDNREW